MENPTHSCVQQNALDQVLQRLDQIDREIEREQDFRQTYYRERQERVVFETQIKDTLGGVNEKLDKLLSWQDSQVAKPGKRWDSIVDKILMLLITALMAMILARVGLS